MIPTTAKDSLSRAESYLGQSRRGSVPWTGSRTIDDCSYFQSFIQYGSVNGYGPLGWVDNWKTAPEGTYHSGKSGLSAGDVVLFDWDGNGVGNHVERVVVAPNSAGTFKTIGANGSDTIAVAYRWRNAYVLGYWRANYPAAATASVGRPVSLTISNESEDMLIPFKIVDGKNAEYNTYNTQKNRFTHASEGEIKTLEKAFGRKTVKISPADRASILAAGNR